MKYHKLNFNVYTFTLQYPPTIRNIENCFGYFHCLKMAESSTQAIIHEVLPKEIFEKILKKIDYKSIKAAKETCKQWNRFIEDFKLVEFANCKFTKSF